MCFVLCLRSDFFPGWWFQINCSMFTHILGRWTHFDSYTLQETNISPKNGILKMIFLFPRWDMLIPWRVCLKGLVQPPTTFQFLLNFQDISKEKMFSPQATSSKTKSRFHLTGVEFHTIFSLGFIDLFWYEWMSGQEVRINILMVSCL